MSRDDDIVDYLLDELEPADRARVERAMSDDPAFREEVDRMRPLVADLGALPEEAWGGGSEAVPPLPPLPPLAPVAGLAERRASRRLSLRPAMAIAASLAALAIGVAIGAIVASGGSEPSGPAIALASFGEGGPSASGLARVISSDGEELRLNVDGLRPSEGGQFYELWLLDGPEKAVSLGSFRVPDTGAAELSVPLPFALTDFRYIDVSVEPEDGVATHSGRSVLRAPTSA
jgi:anti-sigma-K factor RskA